MSELEKPTFTLSDGRTVTLDVFRLKAKHIKKWLVPNGGGVSEDDVIEAIAVATGMSVEEMSDMPVPDFLPISVAFTKALAIVAPAATAPDPN
jgi:hypothetical protein